MQDRIKINGIDIWQPDRGGLGYDIATTYSEDSTRTQDGVGHFTPLFTVQQLSYSASMVPLVEASKIISQVAKGYNFTLHYFDLFQGKWTDGEFYVGKASSNFDKLKVTEECIEKLNFNMTGVNPL